MTLFASTLEEQEKNRESVQGVLHGKPEGLYCIMTWAAVIGSPIEHSLSPVIHRAAWAQLGIDGWEYHRLEQDTDSLPGFIAGLGADCAGLSVTMPCKQAVMPLLDVIDPLASAVGAVNTVVPSSGVLAGFNTDVTGIASAVRRACSLAGCSAPSSALVLGARATASSALAALGELGDYVVDRRRAPFWRSRLCCGGGLAAWSYYRTDSMVGFRGGGSCGFQRGPCHFHASCLSRRSTRRAPAGSGGTDPVGCRVLAARHRI